MAWEDKEALTLVLAGTHKPLLIANDMILAGFRKRSQHFLIIENTDASVW